MLKAYIKGCSDFMGPTQSISQIPQQWNFVWTYECLDWLRHSTFYHDVSNL